MITIAGTYSWFPIIMLQYTLKVIIEGKGNILSYGSNVNNGTVRMIIDKCLVAITRSILKIQHKEFVMCKSLLSKLFGDCIGICHHRLNYSGCCGYIIISHVLTCMQ